jgi:hypothetical protein
MALQDLTPQLRTRLSRMERAVGWFVFFATALLLFGFVYYVYNTAQRKGWFKTKAPYFTYTDRATGLREGDPVKLMGFDVGQITQITAERPEDYEHNVYIEFEIREPFYGYLWTMGSQAKVVTADLLGKRVLEVTKGTGGYASYMFNPLRHMSIAEARNLPEPGKWKFAEEIYDSTGTNLLVRALAPLSPTDLNTAAAAGVINIQLFDTREERKSMTAVWQDQEGRYIPYIKDKTKPYWLKSDESPAVTERAEKLVAQIESAIPNLTNQLAIVLSNSVNLTSNLNVVALDARPAVSNLTTLLAQLDRPGALGEWLLPTNISEKLDVTLGSANTALVSANTNLVALAMNLERSLDNLASLTSNLNNQVEANTNMLSAISQTVVHTDELVQGLKRHWLLRSAFKTKATNAPPPAPLKSPKDRR